MNKETHESLSNNDAESILVIKSALEIITTINQFLSELKHGNSYSGFLTEDLTIINKTIKQAYLAQGHSQEKISDFFKKRDSMSQYTYFPLIGPYHEEDSTEEKISSVLKLGDLIERIKIIQDAIKLFKKKTPLMESIEKKFITIIESIDHFVNAKTQKNIEEAQKNNEKSIICNIPNDLKCHISTYLKPEEVTPLKVSCKRFNELFKQVELQHMKTFLKTQNIEFNENASMNELKNIYSKCFIIIKARRADETEEDIQDRAQKERSLLHQYIDRAAAFLNDKILFSTEEEAISFLTKFREKTSHYHITGKEFIVKLNMPKHKAEEYLKDQKYNAAIAEKMDLSTLNAGYKSSQKQHAHIKTLN